MASTLTAVELGSRVLAAVTARGNGSGMELLRSGSVPIEAVDPPNIRRALERCGVAEARAVVLLVPRGQAFLRDLELPEGTPEELVRMVRFQVERELPLPLEQVRYSFIETGRGGGKVRIQVSAVPRDVLEPALAALEGAGVKVSGAYVSSYGLLCLWPDGEPAVLVEVAAGEAEILVVEKGRVEFSRTAPLPEGPVPERVADEVDRTLLAFKARSGREVLKVVLAGEGDRAAALARGLRERLAREVVQVGPGDLDTAGTAGICAGLFLCRTLPDLLHPPGVSKRFRITPAHRIAAGTAAGLLAVVLAFHLALSAKAGALERRQRERDALRPRAEEIALMSQRTTLAHQWYRDRKDWLRVFDALARSIQRDKLWLSSASFEENGACRLVGKAKDERYVNDFITALKAAEPFRELALKIENRKHNAKDALGYTEDFTVTASPAAAPVRRKK